MLMLALALLAAPDVSNTYRVEAPQVIKVKKGAAATAHVEVVPGANAHVSPDAPISLTVTGAPSFKIEKQKLGRPDAKETAAKGVAFDVPFTAEAPGELKGKLSFFICTEKLCERQVRDLALNVQVE